MKKAKFECYFFAEKRERNVYMYIPSYMHMFAKRNARRVNKNINAIYIEVEREKLKGQRYN